MNLRAKLAVVAAAAVVAPFVVVGPSPAELPVTIPSTTSAGSGPAALTDVTIADVGSADEVVFTFAGDALPEVEATQATPPFLTIPGDTVAVAGTSFVRLRMFPASGVSFGISCANALPAPPTPGPGETGVGVYYSCQDALNGPAPVVASRRVVPSGSDSAVLEATMDELLAGPTTADAAAGLSSWFSSATAGMVLSASVAADGSAVVDFDPALATTIPGASSSAGSDQLLRQLDATVFQNTAVTSATYTLGGSCDAFFGWIQRACEPRTQSEAASALYAQTYFGPERVTGPSANVTEAVQLEDFEAQLSWVVGMRSPADVTVTTASSPARVIVRVAHTAPAPAPAPAQPSFTG